MTFVVYSCIMFSFIEVGIELKGQCSQAGTDLCVQIQYVKSWFMFTRQIFTNHLSKNIQVGRSKIYICQERGPVVLLLLFVWSYHTNETLCCSFILGYCVCLTS